MAARADSGADHADLTALRYFHGYGGRVRLMLPRPVEDVVFDMDGLLVDTETAGFGFFAPYSVSHERKKPVGVDDPQAASNVPE